MYLFVLTTQGRFIDHEFMNLAGRTARGRRAEGDPPRRRTKDRA